MNYFNTNKETGETLAESDAKAMTQEEEVYELFKQFPTKNMSAENLWELLGKTGPITSVRRAISNLTDQPCWGVLVKTDTMVMGMYGKMIHTWRLKI